MTTRGAKPRPEKRKAPKLTKQEKRARKDARRAEHKAGPRLRLVRQSDEEPTEE